MRSCSIISWLYILHWHPPCPVPSLIIPPDLEVSCIALHQHRTTELSFHLCLACKDREKERGLFTLSWWCCRPGKQALFKATAVMADLPVQSIHLWLTSCHLPWEHEHRNMLPYILLHCLFPFCVYFVKYKKITPIVTAISLRSEQHNFLSSFIWQPRRLSGSLFGTKGLA